MSEIRRGPPGFVLLSVIATVVPGCDGRFGSKTAASPAGQSPGALDDRSVGRRERPAPDTSSPLWAQASRGEPIDLARLAHEEDAEGLVAVAGDGGPMAPTALAALPAAPDALGSLGPLCALLDSGAERLRPRILRAIRGVVAEPPADVERIDPLGLDQCARRLRAAADAEDLAAADRDVASSALQLLGEHTK